MELARIEINIHNSCGNRYLENYIHLFKTQEVVIFIRWRRLAVSRWD